MKQKEANRKKSPRRQGKMWRVNMPIKPYLKKFVTFNYGENPRIDNRNTFSRMVFAMLEKKGVIRDQRYCTKGLDIRGHTDKLTMLVTMRTFSHIGQDISMEKAMYINAFIKEQFNQQLTMAVLNLHCRKGMPIKAAIEQYCSMIGIEPDGDTSMDNLVKIWQRTLQRLEPAAKNKNVTDNIITPFSTSHQLDLF